ncbi:asparagine synthetase B, partial [Candidatus Woesearchaeota archaeon]|nr:asparagine synthetase B [Candidatus Woesearchaeota archaeon]MBT7556301.1 asparagine synthetase B [Candidatus Woesearchaeota archaeon]
MCGIFGVLSSNLPNNVNSLVNNVLSTLHHRGPDDRGTWSDLSAGVVLGHTRLSILDLTAAGHQPMVSLSGRYIIVFNGEIYNHQSLRKELQKIKNEFIWKGGSDTETLLACFDTWGVEKTFKKIVGMF